MVYTTKVLPNEGEESPCLKTSLTQFRIITFFSLRTKPSNMDSVKQGVCRCPFHHRKKRSNLSYKIEDEFVQH